MGNTFFVAESEHCTWRLLEGQWAVSIELRKNSPPTKVSATLTIEQIEQDSPDESASLDLSGNLGFGDSLRLSGHTAVLAVALPDAILYP